MSDLKKAFLTPNSTFSPSFFWLWNEKLDFESLKRQIDEMYEHGIRALCPHPFPKGFRPGSMPSDMEPDYLTPEFMDVVSQVMDYARSKGMHVWLYDEGGWPSGGACGKVLASNPEGFSPRSLILDEKGEVTELRPEFHPELSAPYPSIIEPGVTDLFLELTHKQYAKRIGEHFGSTTCMTFTDEPNMQCCAPGYSLPWCSDFAEEFEKRKGYDIRPYLKKLIKTKNPTGKLQQVRIDYLDVRADLFVERYLEPVRRWCHENKMLSSGHLNGENQPSGNAIFGYGHVMRALRAFDVPGIDVIWRQLYPGKEKLKYVQQGAIDTEINNFNPNFPKYASSAAHQNGSNYAMCESLAVYGNGLTPGVIKWVLDYQLVRGINLVVLSAFNMHVHAGSLGNPGPFFGPVNPYWEFMEPLFKYLHRTGSMLSQGKPSVDIAVLFDIRGIWAGGRDARKAIELHHGISSMVRSSGCDFDFVDDDQLADAVITRNGRIRIGAMEYKAVILPSHKWLKSEAGKKLELFARKGGKVCYFPMDGFAGNANWHTFYEILENLPVIPLVSSKEIPANPEELEAFQKRFSLGTDEYVVTDRRSDTLCFTKRISGKNTLYFISNESQETVNSCLKFKDDVAVNYCDSESGEFFLLAEKGEAFTWRFAPSESLLLVVGKKLSKIRKPLHQTYTFKGKPTVTLTENWTLQMRRRHFVGKDELEVEETPAAPVHKVGLGDWRPILGEEFSGSAFYRNNFQSKQQYDGWLDLGKVHHCAKVIFNGELLPVKFTGPHRYQVKVKQGLNTLEIIVANSLLNATAPEHVQKYLRENFPPESPYAERLRHFNHDDQSSGLFGPVTIRPLKK